MEITNQQLEFKLKSFAKQYWGLDFNVPIDVNGRLTKALGRYLHYGKTPFKLEVSKILLALYDEATIDSVLKHELCHWALSIQDLPYKDHDPYFEAELRRIRATSTGTIKDLQEMHEAYCSKCGLVVVRHRKQSSLTRYIQNPDFKTKCCKALVVLKFGDKIESSKERLKNETIYYIKGKPDKGKIILAGRSMIVKEIKDGIAYGHLLHQKSLQPQNSLLKMPIQYITKI